MKKLGLLVMPLMVVSFLTGCKQPTPAPVVDVAHTFHFIGTNCKINGESDYSHDIFEKDKNVQYTIVPNIGYKLPETVEGVEYNPSNGVITISEIKNDIELRVEATHSVTHTIHLDPAGGTITGETVLKNLPDGDPVTTAPTISRAGYDATQVKWYTEPDGKGQEFIFGPKGTGTDVVTDYFLHAKWGDINQFTVNFYNDDGTIYDSLKDIKVNYGDKVTYKDCPTDSTYDNHYKFDGWYTKKPSEAGAELFPFDTPLTGDSTTISIYAKHTKKTYHVTFDANGGEITSGGEPLDITYNNSISADKCPTASRSGYDPTTTWCTDKSGQNVFEFGKTSITDNTTLYAKWGSPTPSTICTVTFDAGSNGKFPNGEQKVSFKLDSGTKLLPYIKALTPTLENQTFAYYEYEEKDNAIDYDDVVTSDITLKASYFPSTTTPTDDLTEFDWKVIKSIAVTGNPSKWFNIGAIKKVQLKHQSGDIYQTVRIIGFNEDYTELPNPGETPDPNKSIGITFEFADLISDENGYSLATYWNDTATTDGSNYSYNDSTIRKALNGTTNDINWFRYYGAGEDTAKTGLNRLFAKEDNYKKSILNMLPDELTKDGILKTTSKYININDGDGWKEETVNDKLFLLSPFEMGSTPRSDYEEAHTTTYSYYKGAGDSKRIKKQIKGSEEARTNSVDGDDLDGKCESFSKYSYAGYNNLDAQYGALLWLRSPYPLITGYAWFVDNDGDLSFNRVCNRAYGAAPAFCV